MKDSPKISFTGAGVVLREIREQKGLSISQLSELAGISRSLISRYENNERNLTASIIFTFAKALKVPPEQLLTACLVVVFPELAVSNLENSLKTIVKMMID